LYIIHQNPGITTTDLSAELRRLFKPSGEDAEILRGRKDDKFSQIVRNLVSHHTLDDRYNFTTLDTSDPAVARHAIADAGRTYLQDSIEALESLLSNSFGYDGILDGIVKIAESRGVGKRIVIFDENLLIAEGRRKSANREIFERSALLRNRAIDVHTKHGRIVCQACGFDFYEHYGEIGRGYIEIHHLKPIFQYEDDEIEKTVVAALENLAPLCSNCHRMVHRNREAPLTVRELRDLLGR
jgi:5-methylcytosine-specific restriction endonuclease McrA